MRRLHEAQYKTISLIKNEPKYKKMNKLDVLMLEIMLMLESKWLFEWGISEMHRFVNDDLGRSKIHGKITYLDDKKHVSI